MPTPETSTKPYLIRAIHDWCADNGYRPYIAVVVDASTVVPMEFVRNGEIVLNVSAEATSRLVIGNELIEFEARFNQVARQVSVPIENVSAIYAAENGRGMAFDVARAQPTSAEQGPAAAPAGEPEPAREPQTAGELEPAGEREPAGDGAPKRSGGLRVVSTPEGQDTSVPIRSGRSKDKKPHASQERAPGALPRPALLEPVPSGAGSGPGSGPGDDPAPNSPNTRKPRLTRVK